LSYPTTKDILLYETNFVKRFETFSKYFYELFFATIFKIFSSFFKFI